MKDSELPAGYTRQLKEKILTSKSHLVGIADIEPLRELKTDPPSLLDPFHCAISIGIGLPSAIFNGLVDRATPTYSSMLETADNVLDKLAFRTALMLQNDGFPSLCIPAWQVVDEENWYGAISHKAVARMAGLGWLGKNLLIITPRYGPRVRFVTILTMARLECDTPIENQCGDCMLCRDACPAGAIKGASTEDHYKNRNEALYFSKCVDRLIGKPAQVPDTGRPGCGVCIKACPFGQDIG